MQGPVKHNALPSCFGWVWQSNLSLDRIWVALYFTNSAALRAALPCKISSCLPIHPFDIAQGKAFDIAQGRAFDIAQGRAFDIAQGRTGRTLPVHPTACAPNPVMVGKCFWSFVEHTFSLRPCGFAWDFDCRNQWPHFARRTIRFAKSPCRASPKR